MRSPPSCHFGHRLEREAVLPRSAFERGEVARPARAVAEVAPHQQPRHPQAAHQHVLDEALRVDRGEARVETGDVHVLDAGGGDQLELLAQPAQARGRGLGREELARVRLERQDAGAQAARARLGHDALEHRLVAEVHAVEVADGQRVRASDGQYGAVRDDHLARLK